MKDRFLKAIHREDAGLWARFGGFISAIFAQTCGYWILATTIAVLVYADSHDPFLLTAITALEMLPTLLISPYAGVLTDRYERRLILVGTTILQVVCVAGIATLATLSLLTVVIMLVGTLLLGTIAAFDQPARGALVPTMVRPEHIQRGLATSYIAYNGARIVGPAVAGLMIGAGGGVLATWLAAGLYGALLPAIPLARPVGEIRKKAETGQTPSFQDGLRYLRGLPLVQIVLGFNVVIGIFGWMPITLMPAIATDLVGTDASGLGMLLSASAIGSICGNTLIAIGWVKIRRAHNLVWNTLFLAVAMVGLGLSHELYLSIALSALAGINMSMTYTATSGLMHETIDDHYRGRIVGIQSAGISLTPIPYLAIGLLARAEGLSITLLTTAAVIISLSVTLTILAIRLYKRPFSST